MKPAGFNPKARWDRHIPETENHPHDHDNLNEKIEVLAYFKAGRIYPRLFLWNNQEYNIKRITYNWQEKQGEATIKYFTVDTGADLYQISFNNQSLGWRIDKILQ